MICQSCQQNLATVHLTEIVQKTKRETHLCEECAKSKGISYSAQFSVKDFLGGLDQGKEPAAEESGVEPAAAPAPAAQETIPPCPSCKLTFAEFRATGRLGCHNDYEHFKRGLVPLLEKIHAGNRQHTGRVPQRIGERIERERRLKRCREELKQAVEAERYEEAAKLRDLIQTLEQGGPLP